MKSLRLFRSFPLVKMNFLLTLRSRNQSTMFENDPNGKLDKLSERRDTPLRNGSDSFFCNNGCSWFSKDCNWCPIVWTQTTCETISMTYTSSQTFTNPYVKWARTTLWLRFVKLKPPQNSILKCAQKKKKNVQVI